MSSGTGAGGGYNGRRAPNFSQYLNELNMIPSPYDQALQQQEQNDLFDVENELAMFANTEFLDFDTGLSISEIMKPPPTKQGQQQQPQQQQQQSQQQSQIQSTSAPLSHTLSRRSSSLDEPPNFQSGDEFKFYNMLHGTDFLSPSYPFDTELSPVQPEASAGYPPSHPQEADVNAKIPHPQSLMLPQELQPQSPTDMSVPHGANFDPLAGSDASPTTTVAPSLSSRTQKLVPSGGNGANANAQPATATAAAASSPATGIKRKASAQGGDEFNRVAQEEDRRRRNTAASARFRVKKKEREKNMERMVKDMTMKSATLESRVSQLEMENKWLKSLITEKNSWADSDLSSLFQKFKETTQQAGQGLDQKTQQQLKGQTSKPAPIQPNLQPQSHPQIQQSQQPQPPVQAAHSYSSR